jgi:hypothetical protein
LPNCKYATPSPSMILGSLKNTEGNKVSKEQSSVPTGHTITVNSEVPASPAIEWRNEHCHLLKSKTLQSPE